MVQLKHGGVSWIKAMDSLNRLDLICHPCSKTSTMTQREICFLEKKLRGNLPMQYVGNLFKVSYRHFTAQNVKKT